MTKAELEAYLQHVQEHYPDWPNCAIADCPYKANTPDSDKCCAHQLGEVPPAVEEYFDIVK